METKTISIVNFAGIWKDVSKEEIKDMKANIILLKKKSTENLLKNYKSK